MAATQAELSKTAGKPIHCRAAVARKAGEPLVIEEVIVAPPKACEVRIKIVCTSLCHSDVTFWKLKDFPGCFPRILGHEAFGIVESVGENVQDLKEGDSVIPIFLPDCTECIDCTSKKSNSCSQFQFKVSPWMLRDGTSRFTTVDGETLYHFLSVSSFAEYTVVDIANVTKIDPRVPPNRACLFSCGVSTGVGAALKTANVEQGSTVVIFGLGGIGLAVAEGARICGASRIIGVDINTDKFEIGKQFGVTDPPPHPSGGRAPGPPPPPGAPRPPGGGPPPPPPFGSKGPAVGRGLPAGRGQGFSRAAGGVAPRRSNLKPLHWSKVTRALQGSLWDELQRNGETQLSPEFDFSELETLFSATVPKSDNAGKSGGRRKSVGSKPDRVHLVDLRRANNTEIMLTKVKMPLPDMMAAALAMDESILDADQVENLIKFCPTKDEMELLKNYTGDQDLLGKCEQFFLELMKVPRVESKLRVFLFKIQFNSQVTDFKKSLNTVNSACEEVRHSLKLKEILKKILYLGNALNQGTARGSAIGFKLDSLLKLTDTRATNNKMTLMHYLCKVLASKSPSLLDFHVDLVSLEAASKIQLKSLAEEMQAIIKGLEKVKKELEASETDGPVSEIFRKTLKEFVGVAEAQVGSVKDLYSVAGRNADALALYFGEDPARCPFEQVTATLLNFVRLFRKAHEENLKQAELERKKVQKEEMENAKGVNLNKKGFK